LQVLESVPAGPSGEAKFQQTWFAESTPAFVQLAVFVRPRRSRPVSSAPPCVSPKPTISAVVPRGGRPVVLIRAGGTPVVVDPRVITATSPLVPKS